MPQKLKSYQVKAEAQYYANRDAEAARCFKSLMPGQKMLTCSICGKVCKVPEWQKELHSLVTNLGKCGHHPGEIPY